MVYEHTWTGSHLSTVQRGLEQSPCEVATFDLTIWSNFPVRFLTSVYAYFSIHFTSSSCLMCFGCLKDHLTTFFSLTTFQKLRRRNLLHWWHADSTVCLLSWLLVQPLHLLCEFMFSIAFQESLSAHLLSPLRLASVPSVVACVRLLPRSPGWHARTPRLRIARLHRPIRGWNAPNATRRWTNDGARREARRRDPPLLPPSCRTWRIRW
mmetsp:Transcript_11268/g.69607  ORF Transcript_11268/g.69607 Transcript_11268/m.69607 type:complete len:209 (+) Transcript_11268:1767-2393(+)